MPNFVKVATVSQVAPGTGMVATVNDKEVAVFNVDGTFHAIDNVCKHRGGPLGEGELDGDTVTCPWHAWQYNVKTGACMTKEGITVDKYEVRVEDGERSPSRMVWMRAFFRSFSPAPVAFRTASLAVQKRKKVSQFCSASAHSESSAI